MPTAPPTPAEKFAALLTGLSRAVAAMSGGDRLSYFLIGLIIERIRPIKQAFGRLVAVIQAGTFVPRRYTPRRRPTQCRRWRESAHRRRVFVAGVTTDGLQGSGPRTAPAAVRGTV